MKRKSMNYMKVLLTLAFASCLFTAGAQTYFVNNNAYVVVSSGTRLYIDGNVVNQNNGQFDNHDSIYVTGNWTNNASNNLFVNSTYGTVHMIGAAQQIGGTNPTHFHNLRLAGSGIKSMAVNSRVKGSLHLTDRELSTGNYTMFVDNQNNASVTRTTGFVSSGSSGYLARAINNSQPYLFPVGEFSGSLTYRPVEITPPAIAPDTFLVRFVNHNPTTDGFDVTQKESSLCIVNNDYYHHIARSGSNSANITFYFDSLVDGNFTKVGKWETSPVAQWVNTTTTILSYQPSPAFSTITINGWNDFTPTPFALAKEQPNATINAVAPICLNAAPFNLTATELGGVWSGTGITDQNAGTFDPATAGVGSHIIQYSINLGCASTDTVVVTVSPLVGTPSNPHGNGNICQGTVSTTYTTTASNATSYSWTLSPASAGSISGTGTTGTVTWDPAFHGTATVGVAAVNGCGTSIVATATVIVDPLPGLPSNPSGAISVCQGTVSSAYTTSANYATTYNWTITPGSAGSISGTGTTGTVSWDPGFSGSATISVTSTNSCGTSNAAQLTVSVGPLPGVPVTPSGAVSVCQGTASSAYTTSATNAVSYTWSLSPVSAGSISGTGTTGTVSWDAGYSGPATVSVTSTNACGTSTSASLSVTVNPLPGVPTTPSGAVSVCQGTVSTPYTTSATNATTYTWSLTPASAGSISGTGTTGTVSWDAGYSGPATVSVTSTNACGTSTSASLSVTVNPLPGVPTTPSGAVSVCQGTVSTPYTTSATNATTYTWSLTPASAGSISGSSTTGTVTWDPSYSGTATVAVTSTNACGTSTSATVNVTVNPLPGVPTTPSGAVSVCQGTVSTPYTTSATNATTYTWSLTPASAGSISGTGTTGTVTWDPSYSGTATVAVTSTNACGTSTSATVNVTVGPLPGTPTAPSGTTTLCQGSTSTAYTTSATNAATYNWSLSPASAGSVSGTGTTGTVTWDPAFSGTATLAVTATNACGTSTQASTTITVNPLPDQPSIIHGPTLICQGTPSSSYSTSSTNGTSYTWTVTPASAGTISGSGTNITVLWDPAYSGSATIGVTSNNSCGTSAQTTLAVTIDPLPGTPGSISGSTSVCQGTPTSAYSTTSSNATAYNWSMSPSFAGTLTPAGGNLNVSWQPTFNGTVVISVSGTNNCGTSDTTTISVTVTSLPGQASIPNGNVNVCEGETGVTYTTSSTNATSYYWYLVPANAGTLSGTGSTVTVNWATGYSGTAQLCAAGVNSCDTSASNCLTIMVNPLPIAGFSHSTVGNTTTFTNTSLYETSSYWDFGDGNTSTQPNVTHVYSSNGTYTVMLVVSNSCGSDTVWQNVTLLHTGIAENNGGVNVSVNPNPFNTDAVVSIVLDREGMIQAELYDIEGRRILLLDESVKSAGEYTYTIHAASVGYVKGMYFLRISINGATTVKKIIHM